jgi:putative ABC transport system permease protein
MIQPRLYGELGGDLLDLFEPDALVLSAPRPRDLGVARADALRGARRCGDPGAARVSVLSSRRVPAAARRHGHLHGAVAVRSLGVLNRVDLRLAPDVDRERFAGDARAGAAAGRARRSRRRSSAIAPSRHARVSREPQHAGARRAADRRVPGVLDAGAVGAAPAHLARAAARARRRRGELQAILVGEGTVLGALGSALGVGLGHLIAAVVRRLGGDLGGGYFESTTRRCAAPARGAGVLPARHGRRAAPARGCRRARPRRSPARALKAGDVEPVLERLRAPWPGLGCSRSARRSRSCRRSAACRCSATSRRAAAVRRRAAGAARERALLARVPRTGRVALDVGVAQLRGSVGPVTVSLAAVIVSFSLMVAMAIMVYSFRDSFERWLDDVLPADIVLRASSGSDTAYWTPEVQARLLQTPGVARLEFHRIQHVLLAPDRPAVSVIARPIDPAEVGQSIPVLVDDPSLHRADRANAWVSEAVADLYGAQPGSTLTLPLGGQAVPVVVAGIWRDYARSFGAIVVDLDWYVARTGDRVATEANAWLERGADPAAVIEAFRARLPDGDEEEIITSGGLRELSLRIFDRAFAITYALEAVAVIIGLVGIGFAASSQALARRGEFAMLRHVGLRRGEVVRMLAAEGTLPASSAWCTGSRSAACSASCSST